LTTTAGNASPQLPAKAERIRAAVNDPKLLAPALQSAVINCNKHPAKNAGRVPKYNPTGTQIKFYVNHVYNGHTPIPRMKVPQLKTPLLMVAISSLNSFDMITIAEVIPAWTQGPSIANTITGIKAAIFFHWGQLRGSLGSSAGWGTRTMSLFALVLRLGPPKVRKERHEVPSTSFVVP
jgi:hypothetical protein